MNDREMYNYNRKTGHGMIGKDVMEWAMLALQIKKKAMTYSSKCV